MTEVGAETTPGDASTRPGHSPYRLGAGVGILLTLAAVLLFISFIALWMNRQIFDSQQWTKTSTEVIEQPAVRDALANYMVDQLFQKVNVEQEIKQQLPDDWGVLASPATSALRSVTLSGTKSLLSLPVTQQAWSAANEIAHKSLIALLSGDDRGGVSTQSGAVTINARTILQQAATKLGLSGNLVSKIPENAGSFEIWQSDDLATAQNAYKVFKNLSWVFALLTVLLYVLAIVLAKQRRRRAVIAMGGSFVVVGLLVLITVSLARAPIVDSLAQTSSVVPAVDDIYGIATELLRRMAGSLIFTGVLVLAASLLAGPYGWAVRTREFLAPYLRDQLPAATAVAALLFLILLWLVPISGFRTAVGLTINVVLAVAGFIALVSITRHEFPDAEPADFGAVGDWAGERWRQVRGMTSDLVSRQSRPPGGGPEATTVVDIQPLDELERLQKLHASGALTDEEFAAAKQKLLGS